MSRAVSSFTRLSAPLRHLCLSQRRSSALLIRCSERHYIHVSPVSQQKAVTAATNSLDIGVASPRNQADLTDLHSAALRPSLTTPSLPLSAAPQSGSDAPPTDVPSFLAQSLSTSSSSPSPSLPTSSTFRGTLYEYTCAHALRSLGFVVSRTGRRGDMGVDLLGYWYLPGRSTPLRCLVQCKNTAKKLGPSVMRELAGCFEGAPAGWRGTKTVNEGVGYGEALGNSGTTETQESNHSTTHEGDNNTSPASSVVAVLCASQSATKGVREALRRAARPMVWVMVEALDIEMLERDIAGDSSVIERLSSSHGEHGGGIAQILWNARAAELGLLGTEVGHVHRSPSQKEEPGKVVKELRLLWQGRRWEPQFSSAEGPLA